MRLEFTENIQAPKDVVFGVIANIEGAAENVASIDKVEILTPGPVGVGTRFKETRTMFGKEAVEEMEFTAFDPPNSYTVEADSCGAHFKSTYFLSESGGTTTLRLVMESKPITFFAKVTSPIMGKLMAGSMKKMIDKDHADLKAVAEAAHAG